MADSDRLTGRRTGRGTGRRTGRLVGIDVARYVALIGMVATHLRLEVDDDGTIATTQWLAGGRASALFAVLAGVSLALLFRTRNRASLAIRALLVATLGLALGELDAGIAVILTYYGLLFLLAIPFVGLRLRHLLPLAAAWLVAAPVLNQLLRPHLPERDYESPSFHSLDAPGQLLSELLSTGYYPVIPWLAYLLLGLAIGKADLRNTRVQAVLVVGGAVTAVAATLVSRWLTTRDAVAERLLADAGQGQAIHDLLDEIQLGMYGQTPVDGSWAWLLVVAPHSSTPFDLAQTLGSAALVIGACLGVVGLVGPFGERVLAVLCGAGAMTLTLYSLHVVMATEDVWPTEDADAFRTHVLVLTAIGAVFGALGRRGPLEWVVATVSGLATRSRDRCP